MADRKRRGGQDQPSDENSQSIFDLFEPAPEKDTDSFGKIPVIRAEEEIDLSDGASQAEVKAAADAEAAGLQHWTAPPTGQIPAVLGSDEKAGLWGNVEGPSWQGDDTSWSGPDLSDVFAETDSIDNSSGSINEPEEDGAYRTAKDSPRVAAPRNNPTPRVAPSRPGSQDPTLAQDQPLDQFRDQLRDQQGNPGRPTQPQATRPQPIQAPPGSHQVRTGNTPTPGRPDAGNPKERTSPGRTGPVPRSRVTQRPGSDNSTNELWSRNSQKVQPQPRQATPPPPRQQTPNPVNRTERPADSRSSSGLHEGGPGRTDGRQPTSRPGALEGGRPSEARRAEPRDQVRREPRTDQLRPGPGDRQPVGDQDFDQGDYESDRTEQQNVDRRPVANSERHDSGLDSAQSGRDLPKAIAVGVGLAVLVIGAIILGPQAMLALASVVALLAVLELFNAMRLAGLRPATLLGAVGTVAVPAAAFYRGDAAFPLITGLAVVFSALWYLVGADFERPVLNMSLTLKGILWIGGLAGFAGLMLRETGGMELLAATVLITVASDTIAYIGGKSFGSKPLHQVSPNKTWEGTLSGFFAAVFVGLALGLTEVGTIWDESILAAVSLGVVVGVLAPIGDLAESLVKRDLGVKDMGTLLPGHGGVLDRIDGLLFALPGAYYLALVYSLFA